MRRAFPWLAVALSVTLVASARAQLPANTAYVASSFVYLAGNSLVGFDTGGAATTIVPYTGGGGSSDAIGMNVANDGLIVWDTTGRHTYDLATGTQTFTTLAIGSHGGLNWGGVDEDGGMVVCTGTGSPRGGVFRFADTRGSFGTQLAQLGNQLLNAICWNGATGGYVVAEYAGTSTLTFLARDGSVTQTVAGITAMSGLDWSPWDNNIYVSRFGGTTTGGVVQVTQAGVATTLGSGGLFSATTNSVEVIEQPTNLLLCSELGSSPQHLFTLDPVTTAVQTIHQSSGQFGFSDCEVLRSRPLWATNAWVVGSIGNLSLNFGAAAAGHVYRVALSLSPTPGVPLGAAGVLHLAPDHLFSASVVIGAPLFNNFVGVLDGQGRATPNPFVNLPALPALRGIRVYAGAVAATNRGIAAISNCWGTTLQ